MKLLDKIKDLFMDDVLEEDEVELEEEKKEEYAPPRDVLPTVMRETIKKEEGKIDFPETKENLTRPENVRTFDNKEVPNETPKKFNFPIDFSDELNGNYNNKSSNINVLDLEKESNKKSTEIYANKEKAKEKTKFKASPVISPVYGILDKNYSKDEVKERTNDVTTMKRPSKKVDFETVRKKAFGNLADEIKDNIMCENCTLYQEAKKNNTLHEGDILYDMTVDSNEEEVTIEKAYDNYEEFGVSYESKGKHEEETKNDEEDKIIINNNNEDNTLEEEVKKDDFKIEKDKIDDEEVIPTRSENHEDKEEEESKKDDNKVDDDFFELIDSMYKERADE